MRPTKLTLFYSLRLFSLLSFFIFNIFFGFQLGTLRRFTATHADNTFAGFAFVLARLVGKLRLYRPKKTLTPIIKRLIFVP